MKVRSRDPSTQKFPVAPHLQQNKSRVPTVTQGILLPGLLSSCPHSWTLATCAPLLLVFPKLPLLRGLISADLFTEHTLCSPFQGKFWLFY